MPLETSQANTHTMTDTGPMSQVFLNQAGLNFVANNSGVVTSCGYSKFAFTAQSTIAGNVSIQRWLDEAGTVPQGAPLTQALVANTSATLNCLDGAPFQALTIAISGGGVLSNTGLLFQAY